MTGAASGKRVYREVRLPGLPASRAKQGRRRFNAAGDNQKEYDEKMRPAARR